MIFRGGMKREEESLFFFNSFDRKIKKSGGEPRALSTNGSSYFCSSSRRSCEHDTRPFECQRFSAFSLSSHRFCRSFFQRRPEVAPMEFREPSAISSDLLDRFARVETSNVSTERVILFFFFFLKESKNGGKRELEAWAAAIFEH